MYIGRLRGRLKARTRADSVRITIRLPHCSLLLKRAYVRQAVSDKWFPLLM